MIDAMWASRIPMRCALYARFSSENQREASLDDQLRICRARAEREGWQVVASFTDAAISGATALRPGYQALLAMLRAGGADVVLAESLDRFSRDQEHVAGFYKQATFAGVRVVTLSEGEISELHVGLKGTMGALYLKGLADKTRRGLEGRVRAGRSGGGLCYGYRVVRGAAGRDGEPERGLRQIDPVQAAVVQGIFRDFAEGHSPIAIARRLNQDGMAGPRGGLWSEGAIRGHARVGTGLLRNRLYIGERVWNRRRWIKDPSTGRRVARSHAETELVVEQVPELRIIEQDLWDRVETRLVAAARPECSPALGQSGQAGPNWRDRRPRHVLTARIFCGVCGAGYLAIGRDYLACQTAERSGPCTNRTRVRRSRLEGQVLEALGSQLMQPDKVAVFIGEFTAEWNRLVAEASAGLAGKQRELEAVRRKLAGLIDAIADGLRAPGLQGKLDELERRKAGLEAELASAEAPAPRLHPNLAELYRQRIAELARVLDGDDAAEAREAVRGLVEAIRLIPEDGRLRIEVRGELGAILRLAEGARNAKRPEADALGALVQQIKGDAGTGFEPVTFRL